MTGTEKVNRFVFQIENNNIDEVLSDKILEVFANIFKIISCSVLKKKTFLDINTIDERAVGAQCTMLRRGIHTLPKPS